MTRRRWIADEVHGDTALLTGEHAEHLIRVLRAEVGQEFDIATSTAVRRGKITLISPGRVEFALGAEVGTRPSAHITLALAVFKFDRMEWAIEKCTEIGVERIVPVVAGRTDAHLAAAASKRSERWQRISRQAAEQSRRASPPAMAAPLEFKELLRMDFPHATRVVLAETGGNKPLRDLLPPCGGEAVLAIGPEGGWTSDELRMFSESGWAAASLGNNILRAETAAIVAVALALDALR